MKYHHCGQLEETGLVTAFFTSREVTCRKNRAEDYEKIAKDIGIGKDAFVISDQHHSTNILCVGKDELRIGEPVDGLVTDIPGTALCTTEADCVPVYLLDVKRKVVGMVHSGWRGTAAGIAPKAVALMKERYSSDPNDIIVYYGPCICRECYEVGEELISEFKPFYGASRAEKYFCPKERGKYLLDMKAAITDSLTATGVPGENITDPGYCTFEDKRFYSYRRDGSKIDRMATVIMLKEGL